MRQVIINIPDGNDEIFAVAVTSRRHGHDAARCGYAKLLKSAGHHELTCVGYSVLRPVTVPETVPHLEQDTGNNGNLQGCSGPLRTPEQTEKPHKTPETAKEKLKC